MKNIHHTNLYLWIPAIAFLFLSCNPQSKNEQGRNEQTIIKEAELKVKPVKIPQELHFATEKVPIDMYYVRESLDRELTINTYWHSSTLLNMKKAGRFFPIIEPILEKNNIPDDFKYVAVIESGLSNAISPDGATGFWQFMEGTARDYGLEINREVDERYNLIKSTEAACEYFQNAYEDYGSWTLAAASFNAGKRGVNRQIERQKVDDYYDLLMSEETERYIFRILAVKTIFENPEDYHFDISANDLYKPIRIKTVEVDTVVESWADFAFQFGINYRILKEFNPWLRQAYLKNKSRKTYLISIPERKDLLYD